MARHAGLVIAAPCGGEGACDKCIVRRFGLESTVRPSLALYNTCADIDALVAALWRIQSGRNIPPF